MSRGDIDVARDEAGVVTLTWDCVDRRVNVLTRASVAAFAAALERALADATVRGIVVASRKRDFCAGLDLAAVVPERLADVAETVATFRALTRRMETGGKPIVAILAGSALGGGAELALGAHRRIAASDVPQARFGFPEATIGLLPGAGGTQRVPRMCGIVAALPLLVEGTKLAFADARVRGLLDDLAPARDLHDRARAWILANPDARAPWDVAGFAIPGGAPHEQRIADVFAAANAALFKKTWGNEPAPHAILAAVYAGTLVDIDAGLRIEDAHFRRLLATPAARAMVRTLFFSMARVTKGGEGRTFARVGVVGAGKMGAGIARAAARAGARVTVIDRDARSAARAAALDPDRIVASASYDAFADADVVIEAVVEDRATKLDVIARTAAVVPTHALLGSNTSTLPIDGLAAASAHPERVVGIHFFSPVERMALVEIVRGARTSDDTFARALDFVRFLGKTPVVVRDGRGFFTTRVFSAYVHEGLAMLREGVAPALVENAGRLAGMAVGPLAVADEVSLSLLARTIAQARDDLGDAYVAGPADDVVARLVGPLNRPGKAAGRGLYDYPPGAKKRLWPELATHFAPAADPLDVAIVRDRLLVAQTLEALRAQAEGILDDPAVGDVASILGWGFPAFTGGVFSYVDYVGAEAFARRAHEFETRFGSRFARVAAAAAR